MKNRHYASMIAAVMCAVMLCGCAEKIPDASVTSNIGSISSSSEYRVPTFTQIVQPNPESSASSGSISAPPASSAEQSSGLVVEPPQSSSTVPKSSFSESAPVVVPEPAYTYTTPLDNYRAKWAYNHITSKQQKVYERLYTAADNYDISELDLSALNVVTDDIYCAFWAFDHDNPQFLELGSGYQMKVSGLDRRTVVGVSILFGRGPRSVPQYEFDDIASDVVSQAANEPTDYDKLVFIHDWIVDNTVYTATDEFYEYEADGPVVYGKAVCEGYSKAFMYFAQSVGIECICVIGKAKGEQHMWNMVNLYGCWYHVDVTWDDPKTSDGSNVLRHNYFLLSDSDIGETHKIEEVFTLPSAPNTYVH